MFNGVTVRNYDPFHPDFRDLPEPEGQYDLVTCCDVMEHVEIQCVDNTLKWLADHTKYLMIFEIDTGDASKILSDGRNAHITQRSFSWWQEKISKHFHPLEAKVGEKSFTLICQKPDSKQLRDAEVNAMRKAA
jgi:hypothetical protein